MFKPVPILCSCTPSPPTVWPPSKGAMHVQVNPVEGAADARTWPLPPARFAIVPVVDAHLHTHILDRSLKITHNVSGQMLAVGRAVGVTYRRGPEGEAVVVLCGEHTVLGPGISNQLCPIPGVPVLEGGIQLRKKILILEVGTVNPVIRSETCGCPTRYNSTQHDTNNMTRHVLHGIW